MQSYSEFMDILPEPIWGLVEGFHNIAQHERFNYRESYLESLQMSGYKVEVCTLESDKDSNAEYKAIKKAIKETECNLIANADDRFLNKPEHILSGHEKSDPMAIAALAKAKLADQLPLIHLSPLWGDDLIKFLLFSRPDFINARRRFWMAKELDMARLLADKRHATATLEALRNKGIAPWEMRPAYLQAKAISATKVIPLIEDRVSLTHDSEPIKELIKRASSKPIWEGLGRKPSSDPMKWICWLIRLLGYEVSRKQARDGDDRAWEFSILESDFNEHKPYFDLVDKLVLDRLFNQF
jgi:hypothetical protein